MICQSSESTDEILKAGARRVGDLKRQVDEWCLAHEKLLQRLQASERFSPKLNGSVEAPRDRPAPLNVAEAWDAVQPGCPASSTGMLRKERPRAQTEPSRPLAHATSELDLSTPQGHSVKLTEHMVALAKMSDRQKARVSKFFRPFEHIARHRLFDPICAAVILSNTVVLMYTTEIGVHNALIRKTDAPSVLLDVIELCLVCFYTFEVIVKMIAQRKLFFTGRDRVWNILDVALTSTGIQEQISTWTSSSSLNLSYLRAIRLLKMVKILRVIRVLSAFKELRMVLNSILGSMKSMLWTTIFILAISLMFGLCFTQAMADLFWTPTWKEDLLREGLSPEDAVAFWGSLTSSMNSLFAASTGGTDWLDRAEFLRAAGTLYYFIFCFYIGFFLFVLMNTLTSLFVDSAIAYSQMDDEAVINEKLAKKDEYMMKVASFFTMINTDGGDDITFDEFMENFENPVLSAFAESLDMEPTDLHQFFSILSANGSRKVDLETFVTGCIKLKGAAKAMDLVEVLLTVRKAEHNMSRLLEQLEEKSRVEELTAEIARRIEGVSADLTRVLRNESSGADIEPFTPRLP
eukprot:TRINITY_DN21836_c0_g1_i2.p1 TRINITY_DN21836_c0_g1~~TRINITY_DN21836_c0_g1_i2.p1  ORF type:complete len:576 (-),score=76.11 TRINITY_DN21836_c0_g1_i2:279-2006(-)